jgi:hypothetical protein
MNLAFRKYHRILAIILFLPFFFTVLTGMAATISEAWAINLGLSRHLLLMIHTGEILRLQAIYPILNGLGLIGLLITGIIMSGIIRRFQPLTRKQ